MVSFLTASLFSFFVPVFFDIVFSPYGFSFCFGFRFVLVLRLATTSHAMNQSIYKSLCKSWWLAEQ